MFKLLFKLVLPMVMLVTGFSLQANESVRKAVEAKFGVKVESVEKAGYFGLYEVVAEGQVIYTDEKVSAFFVGKLIDAKNGRNITDARLLARLPLDVAVKQVFGSGKRTLITFEDPNCGYCKRLAKDVQKLTDVTVYTFLFPVLGEDSVEKVEGIWCSKDRAKAWNAWMLDGVVPDKPKKDCSAPIETLVRAGRGFEVTGTPTLIFPDGSRVPGAVPLAEIEKRLAAAAPM